MEKAHTNTYDVGNVKPWIDNFFFFSDSQTTNSIIFNQSRAYIPPKWAPIESLDKISPTNQSFEKISSTNQILTNSSNSQILSSNEGTKILRLNQMESTNLFCSASTTGQILLSTSFSNKISASNQVCFKLWKSFFKCLNFLFLAPDLVLFSLLLITVIHSLTVTGEIWVRLELI
jgi:hypothetical protein